MISKFKNFYQSSEPTNVPIILWLLVLLIGAFIIPGLGDQLIVNYGYGLVISIFTLIVDVIFIYLVVKILTQVYYKIGLNFFTSSYFRTEQVLVLISLILGIVIDYFDNQLDYLSILTIPTFSGVILLLVYFFDFLFGFRSKRHNRRNLQ